MKNSIEGVIAKLRTKSKEERAARREEWELFERFWKEIDKAASSRYRNCIDRLDALEKELEAKT